MSLIKNKFARIAIPAFFLACAISCKKEGVTNQYFTEQPPHKKMALSIKVGNYWIYKTDVVNNTTGEVTAVGIDSVFVSGDTIIGTETYKKIIKYSIAGLTPDFPSFFKFETIVKEKNGNLLYPNGVIVNLNDYSFSQVLPWGSGVLKTGIFYTGSYPCPYLGFYKDAIDYRGEFITPAGTRFMNNIFVDKIGLVKAIGFYESDPNHRYEKTLTNYHLN